MKIKNEKYAVFILTFGRADRVYTEKTLRRYGYTGDIYYICSDDDPQIASYKSRFGKNVIVFNKKETLSKFDIGDNFDDDRVVVFARNICFEVAKSLGLEYFIEMDDDYMDFCFREEKQGKLKGIHLNLDKVFKLYFNFLNKSGATCVALAQGGDFIGGVDSGALKSKMLRKLMNVYFCDIKKPFKFYGRLNEDTTTYTVLGRQGILFLTPLLFMCTQKQTQSNKGGLSEIYIERGTYFKTFYSVIFAPSCVKISTMGDGHERIHHKVLSNYAYPKILSERLKK